MIRPFQLPHIVIRQPSAASKRCVACRTQEDGHFFQFCHFLSGSVHLVRNVHLSSGYCAGSWGPQCGLGWLPGNIWFPGRADMVWIGARGGVDFLGRFCGTLMLGSPIKSIVDVRCGVKKFCSMPPRKFRFPPSAAEKNAKTQSDPQYDRGTTNRCTDDGWYVNGGAI